MATLKFVDELPPIGTLKASQEHYDVKKELQENPGRWAEFLKATQTSALKIAPGSINKWEPVNGAKGRFRSSVRTNRTGEVRKHATKPYSVYDYVTEVTLYVRFEPEGFED